MIPVVSSPRRDGFTSFDRLERYLTAKRRPGTDEGIERGPLVLSEALLSRKAAALEMRAVASMNPRIGDPILHFQISWREGERPQQDEWQTSAERAIQSLGFEEHQYLIVAHNDTEHFHVHVMLNRVHPESYEAHNPRLSLLTLHKTTRELEREFGRKEDPGLYRWDKDLQQPVRVPKGEMIRARQDAEREPGKEIYLRGRMERFNDRESVRSFAADKPARALRRLLTSGASWAEVHMLLGRHGLEIHAAERGGFTVNVENSNITVKASEVFRFAFSGKAARELTAQVLGPFQPKVGDAQQRRRDSRPPGQQDGPSARVWRCTETTSRRALRRRTPAHRECGLSQGRRGLQGANRSGAEAARGGSDEPAAATAGRGARQGAPGAGPS